MEKFFWYYLIGINTFAYAIMWIDKIKAIYNFWRISEKFLWILTIVGGSFGIFLWMQKPIYHKAWKQNFKIFVPIFMFLWIGIIIFLYAKILTK